ncbi:LysM peptidoglycan-binding domain-containing protein [bacterium]|nr:LysM peptidoglycan-binding domain-containing protein [bacterium]
MKVNGNVITVLALIFVLLLALSSPVFSQDARKIKTGEYKVQLAEWQKREAVATAKIDSLNKVIEDLNNQIAGVETEIDNEWNSVYTLVGTDKAGYEAYKTDLESIDSEIDGLASLSPEELFRSRDKVDAIEAKIAEAKGSKIGLLTEMETKLADLDGKLAALKAKIPENIYDKYTVVNGDYLWKIAKKDDIYGNAYQWIRIYTVNKDQIKNPDLIYPEQIFNIARGVGRDEHLVVKGEYLSKIAGCAKVFNDPTKWTKIYEANKDIIGDANLIYPYQVLTIPKGE